MGMAPSSPLLRNMLVTVAALTFRRPDSLRYLLQGFLGLDLPSPESAEVRFLIVDNDPNGSARALVESFKPAFCGGRLDYVVEQEPGIPAARNCALREAANHGASLIAFTDDDARPDRRWLCELLDCRRQSDAVLVLGPVRFVPTAEVTGVLRSFLASSIVARGNFVEKHIARRAKQGYVYSGGTYNCLIDVNWVQERGIVFCESMRFSGGSDAEFRETVRRSGGKLAWCEKALVYEQLPAERITVSYQFRRAKSHGINSELIGRKPRNLILRHPIGRIVSGIGLMLLPIFGKASFVLGLQVFAMGVGILQARSGVRSKLYLREP